MRPMLARTLGPKFNQYPCFIQPKLNGIRALYQSGNFTSRDEIVWQPKVLSHLVEELSVISSILENTILDGELYVHGWRLQRINSAVAVKRSKPIPDTPQVEFHVFDVVDPSRNFSRRWLDVYNLLQEVGLDHVKAVPTSLAGSEADMDLRFKLYTSLGYEGVMLRPDGPYEFGEHEGRGGNLTQYRSKFLWKHKQWQDDEFVCVGTTPGEGKASIGIGALVCAAHPEKRKTPVPIEQLGKFIPFNVGTGYSDEERAYLAENPPIGKLIKVRFLELSEDGIPLNPSFLAVLD